MGYTVMQQMLPKEFYTYMGKNASGEAVWGKIQAADAAAEIASKASGAAKNLATSPVGPQGENGGASALDGILGNLQGQ